jgi:hypothetical protein
MNTRELEIALAAADPAGKDRLDRLDLEAMEAELLADLDGEQPALATLRSDPAHRRRSPRLGLALGTAILAAIAAAIVFLAGGPSERSSRAYGADLIRFAESSPLLLLEGPGWRVQDVNEERRREGIEGSTEFITGKPIPYESIRITGNNKAERESGMLPATVRQRRVELFWRHESLTNAIATARAMPHPHGQHWIQLPVLGTTAHVDTRAEFFTNQGGPGNRQMTALWSEAGHVLEIRAAVPNLEALEERLGWLTKVDMQTWLAAMPPKVVKAGDHDATIREMLKGIPVPSTFSPSRVPDEGLTIDRSRVGGEVTATVSCLWFRQWGDARRTGNQTAKLEAERAITSAPRWPLVRQLKREGAYPELLLKLAKSMPSGTWQFGPHRWRLLPKAEGLGCARLGIPVLPRKMERQRENGVPLPPR